MCFLQTHGVVIPAQSRACLLLLHGDWWLEELNNLNDTVTDHLHDQEVVVVLA